MFSIQQLWLLIPDLALYNYYWWQLYLQVGINPNYIAQYVNEITNFVFVHKCYYS